MSHHKSVLHALLQQVSWAVFDRLVDENRADHRVRRPSTRSRLVALLYGPPAGANSLREMEVALARCSARHQPNLIRPKSLDGLAKPKPPPPHGTGQLAFP